MQRYALLEAKDAHRTRILHHRHPFSVQQGEWAEDGGGCRCTIHPTLPLPIAHCGAMPDAACCILRHATKPRGEEGGIPPHRVQKKPEPSGMHRHGFWPTIILKRSFPGCPTALPSYYREIAPLGQASAHVPHSVHISGLIEYFSPSEIAPAGHSSIHVPHATQSSPITYAIIFKFYMFIEYLFLLCLQR